VVTAGTYDVEIAVDGARGVVALEAVTTTAE
jgi:hypothetical protein